MSEVVAADFHVLERRIDAVGAVRQVLQSVWGLARAELPLAETAAAAATEYLRWAEAMSERLLVERDVPERPTLRVLLGPERAFAGSLPRRYEEALAESGPLGIVGRRLAEAAAERSDVRDRVRFQLAAATSPADVEECASRLAEAVLAHGSEERIVLVHAVHGGGLVTTTLLGSDRAPAPEPPELLSAPEHVAAAAVRELVTARLAFALIETFRTEVKARLAMAESARSACDRKLEQLEQAWRTARQEAITSEMLEVVSARLALEA
jgi:hypothetical protein